MAKFKFTIYSPYVNSDVEDEVWYPDDVLEGMTDDEKEEYMHKECKKWMLETIEWGWERVEE